MSLKRKDVSVAALGQPSPQASSKRSKHSHKPASTRNSNDKTPQVDATYGQRSYFPAPADNDDSDVDLDDPAAALAYLSSVRQETSGIPHLLVAETRPRPSTLPTASPDEPTEDDRYDDYQDDTDDAYKDGGYYEDGAYLAASSQGPHLPLGALNGAQQDAKDAYHDRMLRRFDLVHNRLEVEHVKRHKGRRGQTLDDLFSHMPPMGYLSGLDAPLVQELTRLFETRLTMAGLVGDLAEAKVLGAWCWALLARTPEAGTLDSTEVGVVRELGKRAASLARTLAEQLLDDPGALDSIPNESAFGNSAQPCNNQSASTPSTQYIPRTVDNHGRRRNSSSSIESVDLQSLAATGKSLARQDEDDEDEEGEIDEDEEGEIDEAYKETRDPNAAHGNGANENAVKDNGDEYNDDEVDDDDGDEDEVGGRNSNTPTTPRHVAVATLDMILTVMGERFGQRDLLAARDMLWDV